MTARIALAVGLAGTLLSGCVAAALPLAAGGLVARKQFDGDRAPPLGPIVRPTPVGDPGPASAADVPTPASAAAAQPPATMQYLYGSGEAAALSLQSYQALWDYLYRRAADRREGREVASVVLSPGATLVNPSFESCDKKPLAVVFDIDETVLLNTGYEGDEAARGAGYDPARWSRWEATGADKVVAVPGAAEGIAAARREGIVVIFNSNRSVANAAGTIAALNRLGLGPAKLGETLWLRGDGPGSSGKDARRSEIAAKYCVVALVGDQLGDFSDLFNAGDLSFTARRNVPTETMVAPLWGAGWFLLPNPVYGSGLKGGMDEVFPPAGRWTDPADTAPVPAPTAATGAATGE